MTNLPAADHHRRRRQHNLISEINVTPLVDIILVLLIIFMITSPMLVTGINVDLPEVATSPAASQEQPVIVSIDQKGNIYLLGAPVNPGQLTEKLTIITKDNKNARIFVRGDRRLPYGEIVTIIAQIQAAGFLKATLIANVKHNEK